VVVVPCEAEARRRLAGLHDHKKEAVVDPSSSEVDRSIPVVGLLAVLVVLRILLLLPQAVE
jgi:hypothetical protein